MLPGIKYQVDEPDKPLAIQIVNDLLQHFDGAVLKRQAVGGGGQRLPAGLDSLHQYPRRSSARVMNAL